MSTTRFKEAQERFVGYEKALEEIRQGEKKSHWIWYIFPQLRGLGRSHNSEYYGIASLDEAKEYLGDPVLKQRLLEISEALLEHKGQDIHRIMGGIDAKKLCSSTTLFEVAGRDGEGGKRLLFVMMKDVRYSARFSTHSMAARGMNGPSNY